MSYKKIVVNGEEKLEHRHIIEQELERSLDYNEVVHHKNGDKKDNSLENLEVMSRSEHSKHHADDAETVEIQCDWCEGSRKVRKSLYEYRTREGQSEWFCSKSCQSKYTSDPPEGANELDIDELIRKELDNGLTGYKIAKKHDLVKKTVYNHINKMDY